MIDKTTHRSALVFLISSYLLSIGTLLCIYLGYTVSVNTLSIIIGSSAWLGADGIHYVWRLLNPIKAKEETSDDRS